MDLKCLIMFVGTLHCNLQKIQNNSSRGYVLWPWCGRFLKKKNKSVLVSRMVPMPLTDECWAIYLHLLCSWTFWWSCAVSCVPVLFRLELRWAYVSELVAWWNLLLRLTGSGDIYMARPSVVCFCSGRMPFVSSPRCRIASHIPPCCLAASVPTCWLQQD